MTPPAMPNPGRILIIKPSSLGDVITGIPVLRGLQRTFPHARISWLVNPPLAGILTGQDGLDEIVAFDRRRFGRLWRSPTVAAQFAGFCRQLRRMRFDWVIDLQGLFRSGFLARASGAPVRAGFANARELAWIFYTHAVRTSQEHTIDRNIDLARQLGIDARREDFALTITDEGRRFVESFLAENDLKHGGYVVIAPGTRWANKLYPNRHWREVLAALVPETTVVLVGSPDQRGLCQELAEPAGNGMIDLAGRTTLAQLVALIASAGAVVCCDSAANLIAPAVGTPFVALIGPTRPQRTGPYGPLGVALAADVPCIGCLKRRCRHASCMQLIDPQRVAAAARQVRTRRLSQ